MQKNIIIAVLALVVVGLATYLVLGKNTQALSAEEARTKAETFINANLMPPGMTTTIGDVVEEEGLYKLAVSFSNGESTFAYMTKDGKSFIPEKIDLDSNPQPTPENNQTNDNVNNENINMDLKVETLTEGTGDQAVKSGDSITVDYTGTLEDGTQFDSSVGKTPFTFTIGQGSVIQGWEQGLIGMKVGEERKLTIPSALGYGEAGAGDAIPPNATLIFTVKLISIN